MWTTRTSGATLATTFDRRRNSLNALRLVLALLVIVSHSWALGGFGDEPELGGTLLGGWAVLGFFAISGFLITASRLHSEPVRYYRARALRIVPGFVVCLVVVATVFAPLSTLLEGTWTLGSAVGYVLRNLALYPPHVQQTGIADTLGTVPFGPEWDGSLWTLFWEACCYVLIGVGVSLVPRRVLLRTIVTALASASVLAVASSADVITMPGIVQRVTPLVTVFLAGSVLFLASDRVPATPMTISIALVWLGGAVVLGLVQQVGAVPLAFLLLALGSRPELAAVGRDHDVSYGVYIYAWPVQQLFVLVLDGTGGVWFLIACSVAVVVPIAALSCVLVEQPAMRLVRPAVRPAVTVP